MIAAINMTLDGYCDHTAIEPDAEIHQHYTDLLNSAGVILYGRITYELMQFWQGLVKNPSGEKSMDDFARAIDKVPKIVFSRTLKNTGWNSARLSKRTIEEEVSHLKGQEGKDIFVGCRSLILQLMKANAIDEYQLCIHPVIAGGGLTLFENTGRKDDLKLINTRAFSGGAVIHYYEVIRKGQA